MFEEGGVVGGEGREASDAQMGGAERKVAAAAAAGEEDDGDGFEIQRVYGGAPKR